jgi:glycine/D-amino acid oxidase-like deaminating enzyme
MNRLAFLQTTIGALGAPAVPFYDRIDRIVPIRADPDGLIRITVCTRPFRAAGPRLDVEQLGAKTLFHQYGHGGSGWSLSWGSAGVVLEKLLARSQGERDIAIIGCGAIGLTTAIVAQRLGLRPTIYAKEQFPFVRSARATGSFTPDSRIALTSAADAGFPALWERMARESFTMYQSYLGLPGTPVEWNDSYVFSNLTRDQIYASAERGNTHGFASYSDRIDDLFPARRDLELRDGAKPYKVKTALRKTRMKFNIADYSRQLLDEFKIGGATIEPREFATPSDVASVPQRLIVNCTGYGARKLWSDDSLIPVRGQIGWLPPQEGVNYAMALDNLIITGRRDGIAVQPTPQGDDTGWNDDSEVPDREAAKAGVMQLARFYETAAARTVTARAPRPGARGASIPTAGTRSRHVGP